MHIPSNPHFQKAVGGVRNSSMVIRVEWKWHQCFKQFSLHAKQSSNSFNIMRSKHFYLWQWSFDIVLFSENNVFTWPSRISKRHLCLWVLERCPDESLKDCRRQTSKPVVVWIHSLAIMPQPKGAIFSHRKRWVLVTGFKHNQIMQNQGFQHLKAIFIHFMQFCGPWITHKNDISINLGQVLEWKKILDSNIFYHFRFVV